MPFLHSGVGVGVGACNTDVVEAMAVVIATVVGDIDVLVIDGNSNGVVAVGAVLETSEAVVGVG